MKTCPTCQRTYPDDFSLCPRDGATLTDQATETEAQLAAGLSRRFRIVRRLGKGGMGTVFLAEQLGVGNRPVALKVLNRKFLDDPDFLRRFQNEATSTGRIDNPNVVTIYESGLADDGTPYIAMKYLEGESLREVLKQRGALPLPEVTEILQQAARGLNAAHKLGIILDKKYQKADWGKRPLSREMLNYARLDTHYLLELRDSLQAELQERGRWDLARESGLRRPVSARNALVRPPAGGRIRVTVIEQHVPEVPDRQIQLADGFLNLRGPGMVAHQPQCRLETEPGGEQPVHHAVVHAFDVLGDAVPILRQAQDRLR